MKTDKVCFHIFFLVVPLSLHKTVYIRFNTEQKLNHVVFPNASLVNFKVKSEMFFKFRETLMYFTFMLFVTLKITCL